MENKKWSREDAELERDKIIEELKKTKDGWTNIHSEENLDTLKKELNRLIDEEVEK